MTLFFAGLALGLLLNRQKKDKPLLRTPLACWFGPHAVGDCERGGEICARCQFFVDGKWQNTFWTL